MSKPSTTNGAVNIPTRFALVKRAEKTLEAIAHAANAYSKLVKALLKMTEQPRNRTASAAAVALLRKPGVPKVKWVSGLCDARLFGGDCQAQAEKYIERIKQKDSIAVGMEVVKVSIGGKP